MKKVTVKSKEDILHLLLRGYVIAVKDSKFSSFGGFQRWLYDGKTDLCRSCEAYWTDQRKRVKSHSVKKTIKILWKQRENLYVYTQGKYAQRVLRKKNEMKVLS